MKRVEFVNLDNGQRFDGVLNMDKVTHIREAKHRDAEGVCVVTFVGGEQQFVSGYPIDFIDDEDRWKEGLGAPVPADDLPPYFSVGV